MIKTARIPHLVAVAVIVIATSACHAAPQKPKYPAFVSYTDRQKARVDTANSQFGSITDRLAAIGQDVYAGNDFQQVDTVINDGPSSSGIKILVTGSALSNGFVTLKWGKVVALNENDAAGKETELRFEKQANGSYTAEQEIAYDGKFNVITSYGAKHGGEGDIKLFVSSTNSHAISSANFTHNIKVLSEYGNDDAPQETD